MKFIKYWIVGLAFVLFAYVCILYYLHIQLRQYAKEDNIVCEFYGIGLTQVDSLGLRRWLTIRYRSNDMIVGRLNGIGTSIFPWNRVFLYKVPE